MGDRVLHLSWLLVFTPVLVLILAIWLLLGPDSVWLKVVTLTAAATVLAVAAARIVLRFRLTRDLSSALPDQRHRAAIRVVLIAAGVYVPVILIGVAVGAVAHSLAWGIGAACGTFVAGFVVAMAAITVKSARADRTAVLNQRGGPHTRRADD